MRNKDKNKNKSTNANTHRPTYVAPLFDMPRAHPWLFACIYLPVIGSIIAASVIHRFHFFYPFIPGFWCFCIAGMLIKDVKAGKVTLHINERGHSKEDYMTVRRRRSPVMFWLHFAFWGAGYLFGACFPVVYALQEKDRAAQQPPSAPVPDAVQRR